MQIIRQMRIILLMYFSNEVLLTDGEGHSIKLSLFIFNIKTIDNKSTNVTYILSLPMFMFLSSKKKIDFKSLISI